MEMIPIMLANIRKNYEYELCQETDGSPTVSDEPVQQIQHSCLGSLKKSIARRCLQLLEFLVQEFKMKYTSIYAFTLTKSIVNQNILWYLNTITVDGLNKIIIV